MNSIKIKYSLFLCTFSFYILLYCTNFRDIKYPDCLYMRYPNSISESCESVTDINGNDILISTETLPIIKKAFIYSIDNENSKYHLTIFTESLQLEKIDNTPYYPVLRVSNKYYPFIGGSRRNNEYYRFSIELSPDEAHIISQYLDIPKSNRKYFGYELKSQFINKKAFYKLAEDIMIEFQLENVGNVPFTYAKGGKDRGSGRYNRFNFKIYLNEEIQEDIGISRHFGGIFKTQTLYPGDADSQIINLRNWCAFDKPGIYEVHGSYELSLSVPQDIKDEIDIIKHCHECWDDKIEKIFYINIVETE